MSLYSPVAQKKFSYVSSPCKFTEEADYYQMTPRRSMEKHHSDSKKKFFTTDGLFTDSEGYWQLSAPPAIPLRAAIDIETYQCASFWSSSYCDSIFKEFAAEVERHPAHVKPVVPAAQVKPKMGAMSEVSAPRAQPRFVLHTDDIDDDDPRDIAQTDPGVLAERKVATNTDLKPEEDLLATDDYLKPPGHCEDDGYNSGLSRASSHGDVNAIV